MFAFLTGGSTTHQTVLSWHKGVDLRGFIAQLRTASVIAFVATPVVGCLRMFNGISMYFSIVKKIRSFELPREPFLY